MLTCFSSGLFVDYERLHAAHNVLGREAVVPNNIYHNYNRGGSKQEWGGLHVIRIKLCSVSGACWEKFKHVLVQGALLSNNYNN